MNEKLKKAREVFEKWNPSRERKLANYLKLFPEQFEKFKDSERARIKGLNEDDLYSLGRVFEQQSMLNINEDATFAQLGATPTLAYDFITAMYGKSVIPYIASEQVIDEVQGLVYFENILAMTTRGNITGHITGYDEQGRPIVNEDHAKVDVLNKAAGVPTKYPQGFAGEMIYGEGAGGDKLITPDDSTTAFTFNLKYAPLRPNYIKLTTGTVTVTDDGKGNLIGVGAQGTVNYVTGEVKLTFTKAPAAADVLVADYATNFELGTLPAITTELDSKMVKANVYGLQTDTSVISSYMMGKRFNFDLQERAVQILQEQILNEITTELIAKIVAACVENKIDETQFDMKVPTGVSQQAHFNSVDYTFGVVAQKMAKRSGKGTLTVALAGPAACAFLTQNAKFKRLGEATAFATVYGVYDNTTIVIRCPQLVNLGGDNSIYFIYKGDAAYDAACVYAPYMPLVGVQDLPVPTSLLNRRSAVASMAAIDVLVPGYMQKFTLVNAGG